jgi:hypothetical protein
VRLDRPQCGVELHSFSPNATPNLTDDALPARWTQPPKIVR